MLFAGYKCNLGYLFQIIYFSNSKNGFVVNAYHVPSCWRQPIKPITSVPWPNALANSSGKSFSIWSGNRTHTLRTSRLLFWVFADCATGDDNSNSTLQRWSLLLRWAPTQCGCWLRLQWLTGNMNILIHEYCKIKAKGKNFAYNQGKKVSYRGVLLGNSANCGRAHVSD
jgi:hypothetical protein